MLALPPLLRRWLPVAVAVCMLLVPQRSFAVTAEEAFGYCGDYVCNSYEDCFICAVDCGECECGNGTAAYDEECDGTDFLGQDCLTFGYDSGELFCTSSCEIDQSDCQFDQCNDGEATGSEECDGSDFMGASCEDYGYDGGDLYCTGSCEIDLSGCYECGDGSAADDEECDDTDLKGETCQTQGYDHGDLSCTSSCEIDLSECYDDVCGDDVATGMEECDGADFLGFDCTYFGYDAGDLGCTNSCQVDLSDCYDELCGNGTIDAAEGEECDDGNVENNDGCSNACLEEYCGDAIVNYDSYFDEIDECDDGIDNEDGQPNTCKTDCTLPYCGDGLEDNAYGEECDDGNGDAYDGCYDCEIEQLYCCTQYTVQGVPSQVVSDQCRNSLLRYDPFTCALNCEPDYCQSCGGGGVFDVLFCAPDYCDQLGCVVGQITPMGLALQLLGFPWNFQAASCDISPACLL